MERYVYDMVTDWLAAGLDPERCTIFIQSRLPEHAELFTLLAMGTPLGWLERVPTYKDQIEKLKDRDLATYGFLGYPLLQAADILIYKAAYVPVGEDQSSHVELTREVARRFNHLYGRPSDFEAKVGAALAKLAKDDARYLEKQRKAYGESGSAEALAKGEGLLAKAAASVAGWSSNDSELLLGHLKGSGKTILTEPQALHTEVKKLPGLDGAKMSKSYGNAIAMREEPAVVKQKIQTMPTDPARVRRSDPGNPERCPVWQFHQLYSNDADQGLGRQGLHHRGHRLPRMQAAGHRRHHRRAAAVARTRRALPGRPEAGALDRRDGHRARAHGRQADDARRARGDGPGLLMSAAMPNPLETIEVHPAGDAIASVIVLHGLGADGTDFLPFADQIDLAAVGPVRWLLPRAPVRPGYREQRLPHARLVRHLRIRRPGQGSTRRRSRPA